MTDDLIARRQLLKVKLEGKKIENSDTQQRNVKNNPSRLHIPTIFQSNNNESTKSLNKNISKSTGNLNNDLSLTTMCSNTTTMNSTMQVKNLVATTLEDRNNKDEIANLARNNQNNIKGNGITAAKGIKSVEYIERKVDKSIDMKQTTFFNQNSREIDNISTRQSSETKIEEGLVLLQNKLKCLRNNRYSVDLPSMNFNFVENSSNPSPKSPVIKKFEQNSTSKEFGREVGSISDVTDKNKQKVVTNYDNITLTNNYANKSSKIESLMVEKSEQNPSKISSTQVNTNLKPEEQIMIHDNKIPTDITVENHEHDSLKIEENSDDLLYNIAKRNSSNCDEETSKKDEENGLHDLNNGEEIYENIEVFREHNSYSKKFVIGPINKIPLPSKRYIHST